MGKKTHEFLPWKLFNTSMCLTSKEFWVFLNYWSLISVLIPSSYFKSVYLCLSMWVGFHNAYPFLFLCSFSSIVWDICFSLPAKILPKTLKSQWQSTIRICFLHIYKLVGRSTDFSWAQWGSSASSSPGCVGCLHCTAHLLGSCDSAIPCVLLLGAQAKGESSYLVITEAQEGKQEPTIYWGLA